MCTLKIKRIFVTLIFVANILPLTAYANCVFSRDVYTHLNLLPSSWRLSSPLIDELETKRFASVCFVTDTSECGGDLGALEYPSENEGNLPDYTLDNDERCKKEGYTFSQCADGLKLGGKKCPYGPYYSQCLENCPSGYQTCKEPYVGVGEPCNGKYASCECTPCETGYDYTEIPEGYVQDGDPCLNCDGKTKYKVKPNPCEGFMDCGSMGGTTNAETCLSGETIKYDNCKSCPNLGTLDTCPSGSVCTYEDCSGLWYVTGCQDGYTDYCDYCAM